MKPLTTVELLQRQSYGPQTTSTSLKRGFRADYDLTDKSPPGAESILLQNGPNRVPKDEHTFVNRSYPGIENGSPHPRKRTKSYLTPSPSVSPPTRDEKDPRQLGQQLGPVTELNLVYSRFSASDGSIIPVGNCRTVLSPVTVRKE